MDAPVPPTPPTFRPAPAPAQWGPEPTFWQRIKKLFAPLAVVGALILKFFAKVKFLLLPILKFLPVLLKTGGSMILSIGFYALAFGVWFAVGFVLLIFVHECGHLLV